MRAFIIFIVTLSLSVVANALANTSLDSNAYRKHFDEITYVDSFIKNDRKITNAGVTALVNSGSSAIPFLIKEILNTSPSKVNSIGLLQAPRKGELALYLLIKIHEIPDEQWPFPPDFDLGTSILFVPSQLTGGPLLIGEYFRTKQGPKKLQNLWKSYVKR